MAMEDLHDHAGPIEDLRTGRPLDVADLVWRDVMVDDHELGRRLALRIWLCLARIRLSLAVVFKTGTSLRLPRDRHRADDAGPAGDRSKFFKPSFAQHGRAIDLVSLLRHCTDDVVAERLYEAAQLFHVGGMRCIVNSGKLDADEDGARDGRFGFHDAGLAELGLLAVARSAHSCWPKEIDGRDLTTSPTKTDLSDRSQHRQSDIKKRDGGNVRRIGAA